jgi:NIPSNAP
MKNRLTILKSTLVLLSVFCISINASFAAPSVREYYELKIYHISGKAQEERMDAFLKNVYLPALHRAGIMKVGVFKPVESDTTTGKRIFVLIPFRTYDQYFRLPDILLNDKVYNEAGKLFTDAAFNDPPYMRCESIIMKSFTEMPEAVAPKFSTPSGDRIYELRAYESATEAKAVKKIEMFNQAGEIKLFRKLDFNPVFFGEVLAGSIKPNLMYMTSFSDTTSNRVHWKTFVDSPEWKTLSGMEDYKNTVSTIHKYMLHPTAYSEF